MMFSSRSLGCSAMLCCIGLLGLGRLRGSDPASRSLRVLSGFTTGSEASNENLAKQAAALFVAYDKSSSVVDAEKEKIRKALSGAFKGSAKAAFGAEVDSLKKGGGAGGGVSIDVSKLSGDQKTYGEKVSKAVAGKSGEALNKELQKLAAELFGASGPGYALLNAIASDGPAQSGEVVKAINAAKAK